ncbi:MAG: single-stranded-DNA-specific exonuclease RecJ [Pirellulaceae bacterium]|nr:single-stranded-DNA-specific exonuclease RecJ [Pirellulaceae bacterium]
MDTIAEPGAASQAAGADSGIEDTATERFSAKRIWRFSAHDVDEVQSLADRCHLSPVVARLLLQRDISTPDKVSAFLKPKLNDLRNPSLLPGVTEATSRIMRSVQAGESIVVYGDYDADGMTGTAILYLCLKRLGANVAYHLPSRTEEGYGLHVESVERLAQHGKRLIITVDCGIASIEAAERCRALGVGLVVTDHHGYGQQLPVADAIVHPALPGSDYPFAGLCGAGVAFKLAWSLAQAAAGGDKVDPAMRGLLLQLLGLAAIGTVADVVPLIDENRIIVTSGLRALVAEPLLGVQKLLKLAKLEDCRQLSSEDIAFAIAPRLNAAGRLSQAQLGVELLTTTDDARAEALASYIETLNGNRESIERSITLAAGKQAKEVHVLAEDPAIVVAHAGWHVGVIGIVAGKLAERYHKPVVVIALDPLGAKPGTGSARSPGGVNLHQALESCRELLVGCGGHAAAAGLKIEEQNVPAFRAAFCEACSQQLASGTGEKIVHIDAEAPLGQLDLSTVQLIESLAPFGAANPRPLFYASGVRLAEPPKTMGKTGRHLSVRFQQHHTKMRGVAFGQAEQWLTELTECQEPIDIAFRPVINEFGGFRKVELQLVEWRKSK